MPLYALNRKIWFPPATEANEDGLLAIGGDLSPERLLLAYKSGIFPWFDGDVPLWWSPDPRFVLFPEELKISKSLASVIRKGNFRFTVNTAFRRVLDACKNTVRKDQPGTWITDDMQEAYCNLHRLGYAHSAEAWLHDELVGGLYGIRLGQLFCGESMFSSVSNASKFAFARYVDFLAADGVRLIDCQVYTSHLESLGARMISRNDFFKYLPGKVFNNPAWDIN